jgi:hypothetical protein
VAVPLHGVRRCSRCEAAPVLRGALSRATRDDGAPIEICSRCGEREAIREADGADYISVTDWPLSVDDLVAEERALITSARSSEISLENISPEQAEAILERSDEAEREG